MSAFWQKFFQATLQTEENVLPIFMHNPNSKTSQIVGAVVVTQSVFGSIFGAMGATAAPAVAPAQPSSVANGNVIF